MLIAVSGNVGSGKTSLARFLAEKYDFCYVPTRRLEFDFIDDFFKNIEEKFFPAQISFLISKAIEIQELNNYHHNIVVDRSMLEDIEVFARLWIENRQIDPKIVQLYQYTADFIKSAVPTPDLYIVCKCPAEVSLSRISKRSKRSFEQRYPPNHVQMLEAYYYDLKFEQDVPCVEIDTTYHDFTTLGVLDSLCLEIFKRLEHPTYYNQLSLFEEDSPENQNIHGLRFYNFDNVEKISSYRRRKKNTEYIYLAAPFTQLAVNTESPPSRSIEDNNLFSGFFENDPYGELPLSYRSKLAKIEKALELHCNTPVLLPHRDVNNWGKTAYTAEHITPKIIEGVENATAVVAIPGSSIGVHLELGIAIARNLPIVIFDTGDFSSSFFVDGFSRLPNVKYIKVSSISKIPAKIEVENIAAFIKNSGGKN